MKKMKLLITDDHPIFATSVAECLKVHEAIHVVGIVTDAAVLDEKLKLYAPDILLMDVRLGEADGFQLCESIKLKYPELKVILMSGFQIGDYAKEHGADGFFAKESSIEKLISIIYHVYEKNKQIFPETEHRPLTRTERIILECIATEKTNKEIAAKLSISERTVNNHITEIYKKLSVESRAGAAVKAVQIGLL